RPLLSFQRQIDFLLRCFLRLFHEAMQEHHGIFFNAENQARDTTARQAASNFPQLTAERTYRRHTNPPRKLDILDVFANGPPILWVQAFKPFPHRLPSAIGAIKPCWQSLYSAFIHE